MSSYSLFLVKGIWHYRFQVAGVRVKRTTRERVKYRAQQIAMNALSDALLGARGLAPCPTLREAAERWLEVNERRVSGHHWKAVERFKRLHLHELGDMAVSRIDKDAVDQALHEHLADHKPRSANQWLAHLHLLGASIVDAKKFGLDAIPWKVKKLKPQRAPKVILPLGKTVPWLQAVDQVSAQAGTAVRLMLGLGLREMEALGARWEWLRWEDGTYTPGVTKGREAVALPMASWLLDHLRPLRQASGWVIPCEDGAAHASGYCAPAMAAANLVCGTPGITPHRLRGTCATRLAAVLPLEKVQQLMRHKDIRTTLGYVETSEVQLIQALDAVARAQGLMPEVPRG